jgi:magnesium transporter
MNVPYPGFSERAGLYASAAIMIVGVVLLYIIFRRRDWL